MGSKLIFMPVIEKTDLLVNSSVSNSGHAFLSFRTIRNFRDIGGAHTVDGKHIRQGMIFRSANPDNLSRKEIEKIHDLNIKSIIDLRAPYESKNHKKRFGNIEIISLPLDFERKTREKLMPYFYEKNSQNKISDISNSLYLEILDASIPVFRQVVEILLSPDKCPVLIHCQAGKDRTGIIVALIKMALKVDSQSIISDFMKSNDALIPYFKKRLMIRKIISLGFFPYDTILFAVTVRQRNIESILDRVSNHYGGIEAYVRASGLATAQIKKLTEKFVTG